MNMSEKSHITMMNSEIFISVMLLFFPSIEIKVMELKEFSNYAKLQKLMEFLYYMMILRLIIHHINYF